jgi:hypothetical protein
VSRRKQRQFPSRPVMTSLHPIHLRLWCLQGGHDARNKTGTFHSNPQQSTLDATLAFPLLPPPAVALQRVWIASTSTLSSRRMRREGGSTSLRQAWRFAGGRLREPLSLLSVVPPCRDFCGGWRPGAVCCFREQGEEKRQARQPNPTPNPIRIGRAAESCCRHPRCFCRDCGCWGSDQIGRRFW